MELVTQAIIGGIFSLIGVWLKYRLENRNQSLSNSKATVQKTYTPPKELIRKGIKRFFWGVALILVTVFMMPDKNAIESDKYLPSVIGLFGFFIFFSGNWLLLKGVVKYIFS